MNAPTSMRIALPKPIPAKHPATLHEALERRRTERSIASAALPLQTISNLLWSACGVNRRQGPFGLSGRTAASASNSQEVDIYVLTPAGAYRFSPLEHELIGITKDDLRIYAMTPGQATAEANAALHLVYVADIHRLTHTAGFREPGLQDPQTQASYVYVDTGMMAAHVYLYCATEHLACWFHHCDREALWERLGLNWEQKVLFAQSVGYPMGVGELSKRG